MSGSLPPLLEETGDGVVVVVWVGAGSSHRSVGGLHDGALRVRVTEPAEGGRANRAAARLVAEALGGRRGRVVAGGRARRKRLLVVGVDADTALRRLEELGAAAG